MQIVQRRTCKIFGMSKGKKVVHTCPSSWSESRTRVRNMTAQGRVSCSLGGGAGVDCWEEASARLFSILTRVPLGGRRLLGAGDDLLQGLFLSMDSFTLGKKKCVAQIYQVFAVAFTVLLHSKYRIFCLGTLIKQNHPIDLRYKNWNRGMCCAP